MIFIFFITSGYADFVRESENSPYTEYVDAADKSKGIVACGIAYNYLMEAFKAHDQLVRFSPRGDAAEGDIQIGRAHV